MNEAADLFNEVFFACVALPRFSCISDDAEIDIIQCNLESVWVGTVFFDGMNFANISFAVKFKRDREGYEVHAYLNAKNIPL